MKGSAGIPQLQLATLNKLIMAFQRSPQLFFSSLFSTQKADSDTIKWEVEYGSSGMTPFVAPGSVSPSIGVDGVGEGSAKCAFFKEKVYFDEEFLNNLRQLGTAATYQSSERHLAKAVKKLRNRIERRREWMAARMIIDGNFSYVTKGDTKASVSYGIPQTHIITLAGNDVWGTGSTRDPIGDIFDAKNLLADDAGVTPDYAMVNSNLLKLLISDTKIQDLLAKSAYGDGNLFANPSMVLGELLGVGKLVVYDELYETTGWLMSNVTGGSSTTFVVDDASDFVVGGTARLVNTALNRSWEDLTISAVNVTTSTITVSAAPVNSYKSGRDKVVMRKKFIADNAFLLFSKNSADGDDIAEVLEAPYGLGRSWGMNIDTKDEWDPEGIWLRVQDKCLPVMYHPDCSIKLNVL
jgi:hypothetical protein